MTLRAHDAGIFETDNLTSVQKSIHQDSVVLPIPNTWTQVIVNSGTSTAGLPTATVDGVPDTPHAYITIPTPTADNQIIQVSRNGAVHARVYGSLVLDNNNVAFFDILNNGESIWLTSDGSDWVITDYANVPGPAGETTSLEGVDILSSGEALGTKFLGEDGDGTSSWKVVPSSVTSKQHYSYLLEANKDVNPLILADITEGKLVVNDVIHTTAYFIDTEYSTNSQGGGHWILVNGAAAPASSVAIDAGSHHFQLRTEVMTPFHFGVRETGADESTEVQEFLDHITANINQKHDWTCNVSVATGLNLTSNTTDKFAVTGYFKITAIAAITTVLTLDGCRPVMLDSIDIAGQGGVTFSTRTCTTLLEIIDCGNIDINYIKVRYAKKFGVYLNSYDRGNNNYTTINHIKANDIGPGYAASGVRNNPATIVTHGRTGSNGSTGQRTVLTLDTPLPVELAEASLANNSIDFIQVNGEIHRIKDIDRAGPNYSLTVYPWIDDTTELIGATINYIYGGAFVSRGGDSSGCNLGLLDTLGCSIGYYAASLYGQSIGTLGTDVNAIAVAFAGQENSTHLSSTIDRLYVESNDFDIVKATRALVRAKIGNMNQIRYDKIVNCASMRYSFGWFNPRYSRFDDIELPAVANPSYAGPETDAIAGNTASGDSTPDLKVGQVFHNIANSPTIKLIADVDYSRVTGITTARYIQNGTGTNNEATGATTVTCEAGYTINGVAGLLDAGPGIVLPKYDKPTEFVFNILGTEWTTVGVNAVDALNGVSLNNVGTIESTDKVLIQDTSDSNKLKYALASTVSASGNIEGTAVLSTGEASVKVLSSDGIGGATWETVAGTGDLQAVNNLSELTPTAATVRSNINAQEEISGLVVANKAVPVAADKVLIQDSEAADAFRYITFTDVRDINGGTW